MAEKEKKEKQEKKEKKEKKEKNKGKLKAAWKGFRSELKNITWPSKKQVFKNTLVVLVIVVICAAAVAALDIAFNSGITALTDLFVGLFTK